MFQTNAHIHYFNSDHLRNSITMHIYEKKLRMMQYALKKKSTEFRPSQLLELIFCAEEVYYNYRIKVMSGGDCAIQHIKDVSHEYSAKSNRNDKNLESGGANGCCQDQSRVLVIPSSQGQLQ